MKPGNAWAGKGTRPTLGALASMESREGSLISLCLSLCIYMYVRRLCKIAGFHIGYRIPHPGHLGSDFTQVRAVATYRPSVCRFVSTHLFPLAW